MREVIRQTGGERMEKGEPPSPKRLDQLRTVLRTRRYNLRMEDAYTDWVRRFILFHGKRHPRDLGAPEAQAFLNRLEMGEGPCAR